MQVFIGVLHMVSSSCHVTLLVAVSSDVEPRTVPTSTFSRSTESPTGTHAFLTDLPIRLSCQSRHYSSCRQMRAFNRQTLMASYGCFAHSHDMMTRQSSEPPPRTKLVMCAQEGPNCPRHDARMSRRLPEGLAGYVSQQVHGRRSRGPPSWASQPFSAVALLRATWCRVVRLILLPRCDQAIDRFHIEGRITGWAWHPDELSL